MSEYTNNIGMFSDLLGSDRKAVLSKDGRAINVTGEVADGINATISIRPSTSSGLAADVEVGDSRLRHIEGMPKP